MADFSQSKERKPTCYFCFIHHEFEKSLQKIKIWIFVKTTFFFQEIFTTKAEVVIIIIFIPIIERKLTQLASSIRLANLFRKFKIFNRIKKKIIIEEKYGLDCTVMKCNALDHIFVVNTRQIIITAADTPICAFGNPFQKQPTNLNKFWFSQLLIIRCEVVWIFYKVITQELQI